MSSCNLCTNFDCSFCAYYKVQEGAAGSESNHPSFRECDFCVAEAKRREDSKQELSIRSGMTEKLLKSCELIGEVIENLSDRQLVAELEAIVRGLKCVIAPLRGEPVSPSVIRPRSSAISVPVEPTTKRSFMEGRRPYQCDQCQFSTLRSDLLQAHNMSRHKKGETEPSFQCPSCPSVFFHRKSLTRHLRNHAAVVAGAESFKCQKCPFSTARRQNLRRHERRMHLGERTYDCKLCSYRCSTSHLLLEHTQRHAGEKIYKCPICPFRCVGASDLIQHERRHLGGSVSSEKVKKALPFGLQYEQSLNVTNKAAGENSLHF